MPGPVSKAPTEARTGLKAWNEPNPGPVIKAWQKEHSFRLTLTLLLKEVKDCWLSASSGGMNKMG